MKKVSEKAQIKASAIKELEPLKGEFDAFRAGRRKGERIPEHLWQAAVDASKKYGAYLVTCHLNLNRVQFNCRCNPSVQTGQTGQNQLNFVELFTAPSPLQSGLKSGAPCVVELHNGRGAMMRVELNGEAMTSGIAALSQGFWGHHD